MDIEFQALLDSTLSMAAQVSQFIELALETEAEQQRIDESILGRVVTYKSYIDGTLDAIGNVKRLSQVVTVEFDITEDIVAFVAEELRKHSPVGSGKDDPHPGKYQASHMLYADGILVEDFHRAPSAKEYLFVNILPYAVKIESGESALAPSGVYEVTASEAQKKYPSSKIEFIDYVGTFGVMAQTPNATYGRHTTRQMNKSKNRYPAIRVTT